MSPGEEFLALQKKHPNFKYVQVDVTQQSSVEAALDAIVDAEGRLDGMVANAGMTKHQPALDFTTEQLEFMFKLNVRRPLSQITSH